MTGALVAVIGPSGSGKDAVIEAAKPSLDRVIFPRRVITRPAGPGEDHRPADEAAFGVLEESGAFAVTWRAHGLSYGVPSEVAELVRAGGVAVVNVSRGVLRELPRRFGRVRIVRVTVPEDVRRERILSRGREDRAAAEARLARADPSPDHPVDLEIVNDGTLEEAAARLAEFVRAV